MENKGFDPSKGKDEYLNVLYSNGHYMKICEDHNRDCRKVADKTGCWYGGILLQNPAVGVCPYLNSEFNGRYGR